MPIDTEVYNNPLLIQKKMIEIFENSLDGKFFVGDPNNAYCSLVEGYSRIGASHMASIESRLMSLYGKRAVNSEDLYHHMSDSDYLKLFSLPSQIDLQLTFDKDYLIDNAAEVPGADYKLVEIPVDTIFYVGNYKFGIYYPVQIRINKITSSTIVLYNTDTINPLHNLNTNSIVKKDFNFNGINYLSIEFPVYQFEKTSIVEIIQPTFGFKKQYTYKNSFYSVRIFNFHDNKWNETSYSMSEIAYDPYKLTSKIKVFPENKIIEIEIPQIYFSNNMIGKKIKIEIYETLGKLDVNVDTVNIEKTAADYNFTSENTRLQYSNILQYLPVSQINVLSSKIVGGSNGYDFEELKSRIIYGSSGNVVPISNMDLSNFFSDKGFFLKKHVDNLTDRIFFACKTLTDDTSKKVLGVNTSFSIVPDEIEESKMHSSILVHKHHELITILPNTIFKYDNDTNMVSILKDDELAGVDDVILNSINLQKVNNETFLKGLYHIVINTKSKYPLAESFDLSSCSVANLQFMSENTRMAAQATVISKSIEYYFINNSIELTGIQKDTGGFYLYIGVLKSKDLVDVDEDKFLAYLTLQTTTSYKIGVIGDFITKDGDTYIYRFNIKSNFVLKNNAISITDADSELGNSEYMVNLYNNAVLSFHVRKEVFPSITNDLYINSFLLNSANAYLSISSQKMDIVFGKSLNNKILNTLTVNWSDYAYKVYEEDVFREHENDVYEKDKNGILKYQVIGDTVVFNKLFSKGDLWLDAWGNPVILHRAGDVHAYADGTPVVESPRIIRYIVDCFLFDIRHFIVNRSFGKTMASILNDHYSILTDIQQNMLENTDCYFKMVDTTGNNKFKLTNKEEVSLSLSLLFKIKCYVSTSVFNPENFTFITNNIISIIQVHLEKSLISFADIANEIKTRLKDFIISVDIGGINGSSSLQTLINTSTQKSPIIKKNLIKLEDGSFRFDDIVDISFLTID